MLSLSWDSIGRKKLKAFGSIIVWCQCTQIEKIALTVLPWAITSLNKPGAKTTYYYFYHCYLVENNSISSKLASFSRYFFSSLFKIEKEEKIFIPPHTCELRVYTRQQRNVTEKKRKKEREKITVHLVGAPLFLSLLLLFFFRFSCCCII